MGGLGAPELIIILLVVLLLFGSTKLPKLAKSLGEASKEFKKGIGDGETAAPAAAVPPVAPVAPPAPAAPVPPLMPTATPPAAPPAGEEKVTLTRAELDALLAAREAQARQAQAETPRPPAAESPRDVPPTA